MAGKLNKLHDYPIRRLLESCKPTPEPPNCSCFTTGHRLVCFKAIDAMLLLGIMKFLLAPAGRIIAVVLGTSSTRLYLLHRLRSAAERRFLEGLSGRTMDLWKAVRRVSRAGSLEGVLRS